MGFFDAHLHQTCLTFHCEKERSRQMVFPSSGERPLQALDIGQVESDPGGEDPATPVLTHRCTG